MTKYKNTIFKKILLSLSATAFGVIIFGPAIALASPTDYAKNYEYPLTNGKCEQGDFTEYQSVVPNADIKKVTGVPKGGKACIRLTNQSNKGYSIYVLATQLLSTCDDKFGLSPGQATTEVPKYLIRAFGWECIAATDKSRWDTTEFDATNGPLPTCATLSQGNNCIVRQADLAANGQCGLTGSDTVANQCGLIDKYLNPLIKILAGVVGLVVTIMVIVGGIEYSTAGGDPSRVASAKKRIFNALFALVAFILLYAVLNWIIPGGLL